MVPVATRPTVAGPQPTSDQIDNIGASSTRNSGDNIVGSTTGGVSLPLTIAVRAEFIAPLANGLHVVSSTGSMSTVPIVFPRHSIQYSPMVQPLLLSGLSTFGAAAAIASPPPAKLRVHTY